MQGDSTANRVARMWMGEAIEEEEKEAVVEKPLTYEETPMTFVLVNRVFKPAGAIADHRYFSNFITAVIVLAAILVGFDTTQTQPIDLSSAIDCAGQCLGGITGFFEMAINVIFTFEVVIKLLQCGFRPWEYYYSGTHLSGTCTCTCACPAPQTQSAEMRCRSISPSSIPHPYRPIFCAPFMQVGTCSTS